MLKLIFKIIQYLKEENKPLFSKGDVIQYQDSNVNLKGMVLSVQNANLYKIKWYGLRHNIALQSKDYLQDFVKVSCY